MYAYADSLNYAELVYKWNDVRKFENGTAWVYIFKKDTYEHLWGLVDSKGNYIVEPRYSRFSPFYNNFSRVASSGKYGFINRAGKEITKIIYDTATSFSEGLAIVRLKKKWKIIDTTGNVIKDVSGNYSKVGQFSDGLCEVTNAEGLDGYIDASGKEIIPCIYQWARSFKKGKAYVEKAVDRYGSTRAGMIDKMGNIVVPFLYNDIKEFINGRAIVSVRSKTSNLPSSIYGLISENGSEILPPNYSHIEIVYSKWIWGLTYYDKIRELRGLDGKLISSENFEMKHYKEGYSIIRLNDKYAVYGQDEKELIPFKYDFIGVFIEGISETRLGSKWGYINMQDSVIIPFKFETASPFSGDTALVQLNGKKYNLRRSGDLTEFRIDSAKFTYTTYPHFVYGKNLLGQWHVASVNGVKVNLYYDSITRKDYDLFIAKNKTNYTLFVNSEISTNRVDIPLPVAKRTIQWFGYGYGGNPDGVTEVNERFGMYNSGYGKEVPPGFSEYSIAGSICSFKLDGKWYYFDFSNSDFKTGVYKLMHKCEACDGIGGTTPTLNRVKIPGRKSYVPAKTESIKKYAPVILPNGEKSNFRSYEYTENKTTPGYYKQEPDTYKNEYIPGIKCSKCNGSGRLSVNAKWTGSNYIITKE